MISHISGKIVEEKSNSVFIDVGSMCYEVFIPTAIMETIKTSQDDTGCVRLITYYYLQNDPSRSVPVLIGFSNNLEKEFFELFITVSGIGPKAAVKALSLPISSIVEAIDNANHALLQSLPGIGKQRAREIVAKLQGKVGRFGLIQGREGKKSVLKLDDDIEREALSVLTQLQYKPREAREMIKKALTNNPQVNNVEQLLNEIYRQRKNAR